MWWFTFHEIAGFFCELKLLKSIRINPQLLWRGGWPPAPGASAPPQDFGKHLEGMERWLQASGFLRFGGEIQGFLWIFPWSCSSSVEWSLKSDNALKKNVWFHRPLNTSQWVSCLLRRPPWDALNFLQTHHLFDAKLGACQGNVKSQWDQLPTGTHVDPRSVAQEVFHPGITPVQPIPLRPGHWIRAGCDRWRSNLQGPERPYPGLSSDATGWTIRRRWHDFAQAWYTSLYICTWHEISFWCDLMVICFLFDAETKFPAEAFNGVWENRPCRLRLLAAEAVNHAPSAWTMAIENPRFQQGKNPFPLHSSAMYLLFSYLTWQLITVLGEWDWSILIYKVWGPSLPWHCRKWSDQDLYQTPILPPQLISSPIHILVD